MKLVVGLGNPGSRYAGVRHNLGFEVVEELGKKGKGEGGSWNYEEKLKSEIFNFTPALPAGRLNALPLTLAKPQTFMNNSGLAVKLLTTYYKLQPTDVIIIHDELDLPLGKIKVRMGGAAAGHHGVESIIKALDTDKFIRVRLGIGELKIRNAEKFVLEPFLHHEKAQVKHMIKQALKALDILIEKGLTIAQNQYN